MENVVRVRYRTQSGGCKRWRERCTPVGVAVAEVPALHRLPEGARVVATPILGGLHHKYWLETAA
jgi:hypothetical protein